MEWVEIEDGKNDLKTAVCSSPAQHTSIKSLEFMEEVSYAPSGTVRKAFTIAPC
jgi:hypothetical protein